MRSRYFLPFSFLFVSLLVVIAQTGEAQYGIVAGTQQSSYEPGDIVTITATVPEASNITVQVENPDGSILFVKTVSSDNMAGNVQFRLPDNASRGKYRFFVSAVSRDGEDHAMTTGGFEVVEGEEGDDGFLPFLPMPAVAASMVVVAFFRSHMAK